MPLPFEDALPFESLPFETQIDPEEEKKRLNITRGALGLAETGLNLAGGIGGMVVAPIGAALKWGNDKTQGNPTSFENDYATLLQKSGSIGTSLADTLGVRTHAGDKLNEWLGEGINQIGIPMMGVHLPRAVNVKRAIGREITKEFGETPKQLSTVKLSPEEALTKQVETAKPQVLPFEEAGQRVFTDMGAQLMAGETSPMPTRPRSAMPDIVEQLRVQDANKAQEAIDARQTQLEFDVKKQGTADFNAAERARQEAAPLPPVEGSTAPQQVMSDFRGQRGAVSPEVLGPALMGIKRGLSKVKEVLKDSNGDGIILFRGTRSPEINANEPRENYAVFTADNPYTASSFAGGKDSLGKTAAVFPFVLRNDVKIIEASRDRNGRYNWFDFDERAKQLKENEVLVARDATDIGPEVTDNPYHRGSYKHDQYAFKDPSVVKPLHSVKYTPEKVEVKNFHKMWETSLKEKIEELEAFPRKIVTEGDNKYGVYTLKTPEGISYEQKFILNELNVPQLQANRLRQELTTMGSQRGGLNPKVLEDSQELIKRLFTNVESTPRKVSPKTPVQDNLTTPITPETIAAKVELRNKAKAVGYTAYDRVTTPEEALAGVDPKADMSRVGANSLRSGSEAVLRTNTQNTVVNYIRTARQEASNAFEEFSKKYVTSKESGIVPIINKLYKNMEEANAVAEALITGDRKQAVFADASMKEMGWNETQITAYKRIREALDARYAYATEQAGLQGYEPFKPHEGYFPSNFSGNYLALVGFYTKEGKWVTKGVASANTKFGLHSSIDAYKKLWPEYSEVVKIADHNLKDNASNIKNYNGFNEIIARMAELDPEFAKAKVIADQHMADSVRTLYRFDVHEIKKQGVKGSLGDRPGLTREQNTRDLFSSVVDHLETGFKYDAYQSFLMNAEKLINDPKVQGDMPNTALWGRKYIDNVRGNNLNNFGALTNSIINHTFDAIGVGSSFPKKALSIVQGLSTSLMMGFGNLGFAAMQLSQVLTGGMPESLRIKAATGLSVADLSTAFVNSALYSPVLASGKYAHLAPKHLQVAWEWGKAHGLSDFSEAMLAHDLGVNPYVKGIKKVINAPIIYSEKATRPAVFLAYADIFHKAGYKGEQALLRAQAATDYAMTNYVPEERPGIYQSMGEVGKMVGSLSTYKHNLVEQHVSSVLNAKQQPEALVAMAAVAAGFYGISGMPGYSEADKLFKSITDKSIREVMLSDPDKKNKAMDGLLSYATNLDFQTRMSMSALLPDPARPLSVAPHIQNTVGITAAAIEAAMKQDEASLRNLRQKALPAQLRNMDEAFNRTDAQGNVYDANGKLKTERPRTPKETQTRALLGLRPLDERLADETTWTREQRYLKNEKDLNDTRKRFEAAVSLGNVDDMTKWSNEYSKLGGDVNNLWNSKKIESIMKQANTSPRERLSGIPGSSISSIRKWEALQTND